LVNSCTVYYIVEVRNRVTNTVGHHKNLLTTVKRRKLKWYGHVTRFTGLTKTILQGTVQGGRRGRQRKRWEDNIVAGVFGSFPKIIV